MIHNHPSGTPYPSGSFDRRDKDGNVTARTGEWGDVSFARYVRDSQKENDWGVPTFHIYVKGNKPYSGKYIEYGPNSLRSQY